MADPHTFEVNIIQNGDQPLALIVYSRKTPEILEIPMLRIIGGSLASTLAMHLIHNAVLLCASEGRVLTKFTEANLSNAVLNALRENKFVPNNEFWVKANLSVVENSEALRVMLDGLEKRFPVESKYFHQLSDALQAFTLNGNTQTLLQVEKSLWPVKIVDLEIPAYIISIKPQWAMDLFDPTLANQTLFGADPSLMLNVENVYYCSSRSKLSAPAHILWYISLGENKFQGTMAIRACSYLDEVVIDNPKALFSRFKRLGVYTWKNVFDKAGQSIENNIMALRFNRTELFGKPVHRSDLQVIWGQTRGKNFNVLNPLRISHDVFLRLYEIGTQIQPR